MTDVVHLPPYKVSFTYRAQSLDGVDWGVSSYGIPQLWRQTKGEGVTVAVVEGVGAQCVVPHQSPAAEAAAAALVGQSSAMFLSVRPRAWL